MNTKKNSDESHRVARHPSVRAEQGQCYFNAFQVVMHVPGYANSDYVEGLIVLKIGWLEHGWVERDGEIIDPTLPEDDVVYFPGLRFGGQMGLSEALKIPQLSGRGDLPIFLRYGWYGERSPEFKAARSEAMKSLIGGKFQHHVIVLSVRSGIVDPDEVRHRLEECGIIPPERNWVARQISKELRRLEKKSKRRQSRRRRRRNAED